MDQWIEFAKVYGPLGFFALAGFAFLYLKIWPLLLKRLEDADKERAENARRMDEQVKLFADTIRARDVLMAESAREQIKAMEAVTGGLRDLRDEVRNHNKR